ncbi:hypothetical protein CAC42_5946 [Sphaceloma murrayae]|uniref:Velvet domain-containing protein n=1 Tax=Sphaceloma murrayae TaxID=2082308 RepID=A0A2K1QZN3_9PEZI|nr:hypothetical protein CAC42_5946 [Sphaceloma murrayae]
MSMQTATHVSLPPFPHSAHSSPMNQRPSMSATSQQGMQVVPQGTMQATGEPPKFNGTRGNYEFTLVIEQQPIRARMCGFGDKDRRPITPPPCVRVIVTDVTTGQEVPADEIDPSFFLLSVDLWDDSATQEKNIVRSSSNSPAVSISTATTTSFPVPPERPIYSTPAIYGGQGYGVPGGAPGYGAGGVYSQPQSHPSMYPQAPGYPYQPSYPQGYAGQPPPGSPAYPQGAYGGPPNPYSAAGPQQTGMFTRNLIGSLTVNAFPLKDSDGKAGHWFILQDLSVRTEGSFRLKMSFMDIGTHTTPTGREENKINHGKTPVLASVFSNHFQVYSAKKFPGVIESTPLSKCFASQGIKIPIRKDATKGEAKDEDDD